MLRFRLGSIPVEVHYSHFLVAAMLGSNLARGVSPAEAFARLAVWIAVVFVSVLTHELGHALVSRAYGYRPRIQLVWTGGLTQPNAPGPIPWHRDILLTLSGPVFGLGLFAVALGLSAIVRPTGAAQEALSDLVVVNFTWSLLNLLPIVPLDGGRIVQVALMRAFRRRGFLFAQLITVATAVVIGAYLWGRGQQLFLLYLAFFALRAVQQIAEYLRGEVPGGADPSDAPLNNARTLFKDGDVEAARAMAEQILASNEISPRSRSAAHHLLGWIAVKQGQGRLALDHFSQVHGTPVEASALAAAFSLVGDDMRSIPLWELAFRETQDPTVRHEWAGALIRAGRTEEALKLPKVDPAAAYACAERVLFIRGNFSEAAKIGLEAMAAYPRPETAYDTACALARAGDRAGALRLLERAAELGFRDAEFAASDADLKLIHGLPGFEAWLAALKKSAPN